MSGEATFAGTTYQARVIAVVYVHILAQMRLGWLELADDTPIAVSGETGGPGDDARVEFGVRHPAMGVQAKHGLTGGARLDETIDAIRDRSRVADESNVVLVVNRASSQKIHGEFRRDLERLRSGRAEPLGAETRRVLEHLGGDLAPLKRIHVAAVDVDSPQDPEAKAALQQLSTMCVTPSDAAAAWDILANDAADLCARQLQRTRKELVARLKTAGIEVRPPAPDARWLTELDFIRQLVKKQQSAAAMVALKEVQAKLQGIQVESNIRYRLAQLRSAAQLQLRRFDDALLSAKEALDLDQKGCHALIVASLASVSLGDLTGAHAYIDRALAAHRDNADVWGALAHVANASGDETPQPPPGVAASAAFRTSLALVATLRDDWELVLAITGDLLAEGVREPDVLFYRADALVSAPADADEDAQRRRLDEAVRYATEALEALTEQHPFVHKLLIVRATAHRRQSRVDDAEADLQLAQQVAGDDPDTIRNAATSEATKGNFQGALRVLAHPAVEQDALLLALRAQLSAIEDDAQGARADLDRALQALPDSYEPDLARFLAAEAAVLLKDYDQANTILASVTASRREDSQFLRIKGRLALATGGTQDAVVHFHEAAARDSQHRAQLLAELAVALLRTGDATGSLRVFDEIGEAQLPEGALPAYGTALAHANQLRRAQTLVDRLAQAGPLPNWALGLATEVALKQEDPEASIRNLSTLIGRGQRVQDARLELSRLLIGLRRNEDARPHLDSLLNDASLAPLHRMQTAQLLRETGRTDESLAQAFRAFRESPQDPRFHRAFITLTAMSGGTPDIPTEVGPNTHVILRDRTGRTRSHTILSDAPIDPLRNELSVADAAAAGLIGMRVGDVLPEPDRLVSERWTVAEIASAHVGAYRDAVEHYGERFPNEPVFIQGFAIGDEPAVNDLAPLIATVEARRARVSEVLETIHKQTLPLGFAVRAFGGSIADAMETIATDTKRKHPLLVEWPDHDGQEESRSAALEAKEIIVTRSGLKTAADLSLLDTLTSQYAIVCPQSLPDDLREEVRAAETRFKDGHHVVVSDPAGLRFQELEAGHPVLEARLNEAKGLLTWLERSTRAESRPLDSIGSTGSQDEDVRDFIGRSSWDAKVLTEHLAGTMYADDLGLRRFFMKGAVGRSFSSVGLLRALASRGAISAKERDAHLLTLVHRGYAVIPPSRELLGAALDRSESLGAAGLGKVFALVGGAGVQPTDAARLSAQLIKATAMATIRLTPLESVATLALEGMATQWPRSLCSTLLAQAARSELALLPQELRRVLAVCAAFARESLTALPGLGRAG